MGVQIMLAKLPAVSDHIHDTFTYVCCLLATATNLYDIIVLETHLLVLMSNDGVLERALGLNQEKIGDCVQKKEE